MTEEEAKTKWCPMANPICTVPPKVDPAGNRTINKDGSIHENPPWARCIGSACMAWRWNGYFDDEGRFMHHVGRGHWQSKKGAPPKGFCGLAGAPQ